ncbi:carbohydrate kinase [Allobranchiibius sp. CTAmp26]|uniref:carbohydrate kinase family protein n=1 Tax=Allobranchiibius sp. CTAmp26 TaxID=2815214 RepID=UPI001AA17899|nr:carbohydrate kinase [Allobranchiibius sp. CTAmp26]MBO1756371.1 carbohydrate kinase [Allobranchiibius sp. CTAmp26]
MHPSTLVIGEALIDIVRGTDGSVREHVGGSPFNTAIGLGRLGHPVSLATYIGDDAYGLAISDALSVDGVDLTPGSVTAPATPTARATLDETGAATYDFDLAWAPRTPLPGSRGHLHTGSIATALQPGASAVRDAVVAHRAQGTISLDPNPRPTIIGEAASVRSGIEELVGLSDVVKASDEDIAWLYGEDADLGEVLRLWGQLGPSLVVATRGGDGALVHLSGTGELVDVPGRRVALVDTVGAGDSFMSGMLSWLLDEDLLGAADARDRLRVAPREALLAAVDRGVATSAVTVSRAGSQPPTRAELGLPGAGSD